MNIAENTKRKMPSFLPNINISLNIEQRVKARVNKMKQIVAQKVGYVHIPHIMIEI